MTARETRGKAVSFASALDPALLRSSDSDRHQRRHRAIRERGQNAAAASDKRAEKRLALVRSTLTASGSTERVDPSSSRSVAFGKADHGTPGNRMSRIANEPRSITYAMSGSPRVSSGYGRSHASRSVGDETEPIHDTTIEMERIEGPAHVPPMPSSSGTLADSLAREVAQRQKEQMEQQSKSIERFERRTLYGSTKRRLERQSRRSIRNKHNQCRQAQDDIATVLEPSVSEEAAIEDLRQSFSSPIQHSSTTAKDMMHFSSQQSHFSIESEDGVYQTQFSFYKFVDDEPGGELECGQEGPSVGDAEDEEERKTSVDHLDPLMRIQSAYASDESSTTMNSDSLISLGQTGYEADRSQPSSSELLLRSSLSQLSELRPDSDHPISVYCPILAGVADSIETQEQELLDQVIDCAPLSSPTADVRPVRPTIWTSAETIETYFGPLDDAYTPKHGPPARADLKRWADWNDTQSQEADTNGRQAAWSSLYEYKGPMSDLTPFESS